MFWQKFCNFPSLRWRTLLQFWQNIIEILLLANFTGILSWVSKICELFTYFNNMLSRNFVPNIAIDGNFVISHDCENINNCWNFVPKLWSNLSPMYDIRFCYNWFQRFLRKLSQFVHWWEAMKHLGWPTAQ